MVNFSVPGLVCLIALLVMPQIGMAEPFEPLPPATTLVREQDLTVPAQSLGTASIVVPQESLFTFDYSIESGKNLLVSLLTTAQWQQLVERGTPDGNPLMKFTAIGEGARSVRIPKGEYLMTLFNTGLTPIQFRYRASYQ